jgi:hypothetical protein
MAMRLVQRCSRRSGNLQAGGTTMNALAAYGVVELDRGDQEVVTGGNPVTLGIAMATAFGWGFRWGYNVAGPWLVENVR